MTITYADVALLSDFHCIFYCQRLTISYMYFCISRFALLLSIHFPFPLMPILLLLCRSSFSKHHRDGCAQTHTHTQNMITFLSVSSILSDKQRYIKRKKSHISFLHATKIYKCDNADVFRRKTFAITCEQQPISFFVNATFYLSVQLYL